MPTNETQSVEHTVIDLPGEEDDYEKQKIGSHTFLVIKEEKYTEYSKSKNLRFWNKSDFKNHKIKIL